MNSKRMNVNLPGSVPREFINGTTYSTASLISMSRISVGNSFAINTLIKKKHQFEILGIPTKGLKTANHTHIYYTMIIPVKN